MQLSEENYATCPENAHGVIAVSLLILLLVPYTHFGIREEVIRIVHNDILDWFHHYGYFGLIGVLVLGIVGLPLPDETMLTAVGYLVYRGQMQYFPSVLAGMIGAIVGITFSYALGSFVGRALLLKIGGIFHLNEKRLQKTEQWLDKYGSFALFGGFFVPGVRHVTAIVAGLGNMSFRRFAFSAYLGAFVWVVLFITLGRFAGSQVARISMFLHRFLEWTILFSVLASLVLAMAGWQWYRVNARQKKR